MAAGKQKPSLLVIVGPTASGKSALAHQLALNFNGEIIAADSRTIYKDMDIGTAKPSIKMRWQVPYWGVDIVKPGQRFSAADFQILAQAKIQEISNKNKVPIMVGGSGLYIDAVLYNYSFSGKTKPDPLNPRHRLSGSYSKDVQLAANVLVIGLMPPDEKLQASIYERTNKMFAKGVVNETKELMLKYGKARLERTAGIVYKACAGYLAGEYDLVHTKELSRTMEWQYARRQRTWFRRNPSVIWFDTQTKAYDYINQRLNK